MNTARASGSSHGLRAAAVLQGVGIAALAILLLRPDDPLPGNAPPATEPANAAAASAAAAAAVPGPAAVVPTESPTEATPAAVRTDGTVLYGRVVDDKGTPIANGSVWLSRTADQQQIATLNISPRDSVFAIAGLSPGEITWHGRAAGHCETRGSVTIAPGVDALRHDFVLRKAWQITVRILTADGEPMRTALAALTKERRMLSHVEVGAVATGTQPAGDLPLTAFRELTAGLGRWRGGRFGPMHGEKQLPEGSAGLLEIDGERPIWVSAVLRHRVLASVAVEPGQTEVTLTVPLHQVLGELGTIRGRVVDAGSREPVAGANLGFGDLQSSGSAGTSNADGTFAVGDLRPGLLDIEIGSGNRRAARDLVELQPGQVLDLGDVPIAELRTITGRCEGIAGKAESCSIKYTQLDPPSHARLRRYPGHASVGADGSFRLHVTAGRYLLRASGAGGAVLEIDTRTLPDGPLVLQLAPETNVRLDVRSDGEPFELAIFDARGRELWRRDLQHGWQFALPFLPGTYRAELKDGSGKVETRTLTLGAEGADLRVP